MQSRRTLPAVLALALMGCTAYKPPPLPDVPERAPVAIPIYIPVHAKTGGGGTEWSTARVFAEKLERAGFAPAIVSTEGEIPANAVVILDVKRDYDRMTGCRESTGLALTAFLTLFIFPKFGCELIGSTFELRRSIDDAPVMINAQWGVPMMVGWFAVPIGLFAGYLPGGVPRDARGPREIRVLRASIQDALDTEQ